MYCKYCGVHNSSDQTYCQKCGNIIKNNTISPKDLNISENKTAFCKKCGTQVLDRYCTECGTVGYSLNLISGKTRSSEPIINLSSLGDLKSKIGETSLGDIKSVDDVKEMIKSKPILKTSSISALKTLGIGLLISLFVFMLISKTKAVEGILRSIDMAATYAYPELSKLKPNFFDFFNLTLLSPTNVVAKVQGDIWGERISVNMKILLSMKLLILLLVPGIAVLVSEYKTFKNESSTKDNLMQYAFNSIIFSILVKILAFITTKSAKIQDSYDRDFYNMSIRFSIQNIWSIISVFLIVFVIHIILSMIFKKDNVFEVLDNKHCEDLGYRTKTYLKYMAGFVGIVSIALTMILVVLFFKSGLKSKTIPMMGIALLPSTFIHTWLMSFGNSITTIQTGSMPMTLGIGKMWKGLGSLKDLMYGSSTFVYWGYLLIICIFLGLVYVIFNTIRGIEKEEYFKKLAIIAGVISIVNLALSYLAIIGVKVTSTADNSPFNIEGMFYNMGLGMFGDMAGTGALKQSYPLFTIILLTFLWIFAIGGVIYFIREHDIYGKVVDFIEEHNIKLLAGYTVLVLVSAYFLQSKIFDELMYGLMNIFPFLNLFM